MKIRSGFVSNSSSSSFLVALDKKPQSIKEVTDDILKGHVPSTGYYEDEDEDEDTGITLASVSTTIFNDIKNQVPLTEEQILDELNSGYIDEIDSKINRIKNEFYNFTIYISK